MANPTVTIEIKEIGAGKVIERLRLVRQEAGKLVAAKKRLTETSEKSGNKFRKESVDLNKLGGQMQAIAARTRLAERSMKSLRDRMSNMTGSTKLSDEQLRNLGRQLQSIAGQTRLAKKAMRDLGVQMERVASSNKLAAESERELISGTRQLDTEIRKLTGGSLTQMGAKMEMITNSKRLEAQQTRQQTVEDRKLIAAQDKLSSSTERVSRATRKLSKSTEKTSKNLKNMKNKLTELGKSASLALGPLNGVAARLTAFGGLASAASIRVAGFIGALVATGGLVFAAIKTAKSLDELRKAAQRVGLDVERFQEFAFAASQLGSVDLRQFTVSMEAFTRRLADAQVETGEGVQAFRLLFGSLNAIKNIRPEEALLRTADAFRGLQTEGRGAAIAADLFTRRGLRMTQFLQAGRKGIEDMAKEARRLGIIFDKDLAAQGTKTVDALDRLSRVMSVNLQRAVSIILPLIERLAIQFSNLGPIIKENVDVIVVAVTTLLGLLLGGIAGPVGAGIGGALGLILGIMITNAEALIDVIERAERAEGDFGSNLDGMRESVKDFIGIIPGATGVIDSLFDTLEKRSGVKEATLEKLKEFLQLFVVGKSDVDAFGKAITGMGSALELKGARKSLAALSGRLEDIRREVLTLVSTGDRGLVAIEKAQNQTDKFFRSITSAQVKELAASLGLTVEELTQSVIAVNKAIPSWQKLGKIFESTRTPLEKFNLEMSELLDLQKKFPLQSALIERAMANLREELSETDDFMQILSDSFTDFGDTMVDVIKKGEGAFDGLVKVLENTLEAILDLIVQLIIVNPLLNALDRGDRPEGLGGVLDVFKATSKGEKAGSVIEGVTKQEDSGGFFEGIADFLGIKGKNPDEGTAAGFKIPEEVQAMSEAANAATAALTKTASATDVATAATKAGAEVLSGPLVESVTEAAVGTAAETVATQAVVTSFAELTASALAASVALTTVASSGGASGGVDILGSLGGLFGGGTGASGVGALALSDPGFAHGGAFTVGGAGGIDDTLVKFRATRGEKVTVTPAGEGSNENMTVINFNFPPGTNVKEFGDAQNQIAAMLAGTLSSASASNS